MAFIIIFPSSIIIVCGGYGWLTLQYFMEVCGAYGKLGRFQGELSNDCILNWKLETTWGGVALLVDRMIPSSVSTIHYLGFLDSHKRSRQDIRSGDPKGRLGARRNWVLGTDSEPELGHAWSGQLGWAFFSPTR